MSDWEPIDVYDSARSQLFHDDECKCYYEYTSRGAPDCSPGNQSISNFKIKPEFKHNIWRWKHKLNAIAEFAEHLTQEIPSDSTVVFIPSSKRRDYEEYDNRFDMLGEVLQRHIKRLTIEEPIIRTVSVASAHEGGKKLNLQETLETLEWTGFENEVPERIYLIDDVITRGTTFRACKNMILEQEPDTDVLGLFWGLTIWKNEEEEDEGDE